MYHEPDDGRIGRERLARLRGLQPAPPPRRPRWALLADLALLAAAAGGLALLWWEWAKR